MYESIVSRLIMQNIRNDNSLQIFFSLQEIGFQVNELVINKT